MQTFHGSDLLVYGLLINLAIPLLGCRASETNSGSIAQLPPSAPSKELTQTQTGKVCMGMSLQQVEAIVGRRGEAVSDPEPAASEAQTYEWRNSNGSYFWATLVRGRVQGMGQTGLPGVPVPDRLWVTPEMAARIQPGMTLAEVTKVIGSPGTPGLPSGTPEPQGQQIYHWQTSCRSSAALLVYLRQGRVTEINTKY